MECTNLLNYGFNANLKSTAYKNMIGSIKVFCTFSYFLGT